MSGRVALVMSSPGGSVIISDWLPSQVLPAISSKVSRVPSAALTALVDGSVP
jgi:hypothetical protein